MNISKNSWHYKLLKKKSFGVIPTSLCSYFWKVAGAIFKGYVLPTITIVLFVTLSVGSSYVIGRMVLEVTDTFPKEDTATLGIVMASLAIGMAVFALGTGLVLSTVFLESLFKEWVVKSSNKQQEKVDKQSGLLVSYLKAKKQKICPIITFTEENKK